MSTSVETRGRDRVMSTTEQPAAGWWLASDGNWYPPELAPQNGPVAPKKNKRWWPWVAGVVVALLVLITIIGALADQPAETTMDGDRSSTTVESRVESSLSTTTVTTAPPTASTEPPPTAAPTAPPTTVPPPPPPSTPPTPPERVSLQNAKRSARSYLEFTAFSRSGLIHQLEYEGYITADATQAVDSLDVDWNEQAVQSARTYLEYMPFSRQGLIDQLKYEGFTDAEAQHGVSAVGL
jgi:hypothetical protein